MVAPSRSRGDPDAGGPPHDEAAAVVPVDGGELEAELHVALERHGRDAGEHVDLAGLQRGEALRRRQRREADAPGVTQHRGGDGPAHVHVQAAPLAERVGRREAGDAGGDAALDEALAAHAVERRRRARAGRRQAPAGCPYRRRPSRRTDRRRPATAQGVSVPRQTTLRARHGAHIGRTPLFEPAGGGRLEQARRCAGATLRRTQAEESCCGERGSMATRTRGYPLARDELEPEAVRLRRLDDDAIGRARSGPG